MRISPFAWYFRVVLVQISQIKVAVTSTKVVTSVHLNRHRDWTMSRGGSAACAVRLVSGMGSRGGGGLIGSTETGALFVTTAGSGSSAQILVNTCSILSQKALPCDMSSLFEFAMGRLFNLNERFQCVSCSVRQAFTAWQTKSICWGDSSGNIGSERISFAHCSATGNEAGPRRIEAYASCKWTGTG